MTTRRDIVAASLGVVTVAASVGLWHAQTSSKTFVLVHGAWGGGWVWRRVVDLLEKRGHKVFTPTMTGVGERSHLLDPNVNLATHINDIVNVIKWERLDDIVLVGHSYGGVVVSGVVEQMEPAISSIVFVDAFVPENDQSVADIGLLPPVRAAIERHEIAVASPSAQFFGVNAKDCAWVDAMSTPHPIATLTDKLAETGARDRIARKAYVRATASGPGFDGVYSKYRSTPGWRTYEVPCGHFVMVDMPERLVEILLEA